MREVPLLGSRLAETITSATADTQNEGLRLLGTDLSQSELSYPELEAAIADCRPGLLNKIDLEIPVSKEHMP
jgi:hypothetical protein